jgi:site-specific DNA-cytosine methylase
VRGTVIASNLKDRDNERDLFPEAIRLVNECMPDAVMLENVRGILDKVFDDYRANIVSDLKKLGYIADWRLLNASDYGVPQLRPRVVLVALRENRAQHFSWPTPSSVAAQTVGESLFDLMASNGWRGAKTSTSRPELRRWEAKLFPRLRRMNLRSSSKANRKSVRKCWRRQLKKIGVSEPSARLADPKVACTSALH